MKLIQIDKTVKFITFIVGIMFANYCYSAEVNDLYQAEIPVTSQSTSDRNVALKQAMKAVVLKIGGQKTVLNHPTIKQAVSQYNNYLTQYRYNRKTSVGSQDVQADLYLVASFNEDKINQLFEQANLSIWGRLRPQVLVWVVEENGLARNIVADSSQSFIPQQILNFSKNRGLPLTLPLMDLDDVLSINVSDLWGRFSEPVKQMSTRYLSDALLIVRVSDSSLLNIEPSEEEACELVVCKREKQFVLDWSLISQHQVFSQSYQGQDKQALLNQVLIDVSDTIYQRYALNSELKNEYIIDVANIDDLSSFVILMSFLEDLSAVDSASLIAVQGENRRIKLNLRGSKQALLASLKLNKQLKQFVDPLAPQAVDEIPIFYWEGK